MYLAWMKLAGGARAPIPQDRELERRLCAAVSGDTSVVVGDYSVYRTACIHTLLGSLHSASRRYQSSASLVLPHPPTPDEVPHRGGQVACVSGRVWTGSAGKLPGLASQATAWQ